MLNTGKRLIAVLLIAISYPSIVSAAVTLPIEVVGDNGTTSSVSVQVPSRQAREVRSLWMQIHTGYWHRERPDQQQRMVQ
jgi:hypothetical protein